MLPTSSIKIKHASHQNIAVQTKSSPSNTSSRNARNIKSPLQSPSSKSTRLLTVFTYRPCGEYSNRMISLEKPNGHIIFTFCLFQALVGKLAKRFKFPAAELQYTPTACQNLSCSIKNIMSAKGCFLASHRLERTRTARPEDTNPTRTHSISCHDTNRPSSFASEQVTAD